MVRARGGAVAYSKCTPYAQCVRRVAPRADGSVQRKLGKRWARDVGGNLDDCVSITVREWYRPPRGVNGAADPLGEIAVSSAVHAFSTFAQENLDLIEEGAHRVALATVVGSVVLGIAAVLAGARLVLRRRCDREPHR